MLYLQDWKVFGYSQGTSDSKHNSIISPEMYVDPMHTILRKKKKKHEICSIMRIPIST